MADIDPVEIVVRVAVDVTRFWLHVDRGGLDECWPWLSGTDAQGYGYFNWGGKRYGAHELALTFASGERRPLGFETCHSCNNPPCCNPRHLRFGTSTSNKADAFATGRHYHGELHHKAKFTDADVATIRRRLASGETGLILASEYGVAPSVISKIKNGRSWRHVEEPVLTPYRKDHPHGRG